VAAALLIGAAIQDHLRVRSVTRQLAERQATGLLRMIELAMNQSVLAERSVLSAVHDHLFSVAYRVVDDFGEGPPTPAELTRIASESGVAWIQLVEKGGRPILAQSDNQHPPEHINLPSPLEAAEEIVGFVPDSTGSLQHYAIAVALSGDKWVLVGLEAAEILALRGEVGLGAILGELGRSREVSYAALVSGKSIMASTPDPPPWLEGPDDPGFSSGVAALDTLGFVDTPSGMLFEVRTTAPGHANLALRLGVEAEELLEIRQKSFVTLVIRSTLFIVLTALVSAVLLTRYRAQVLATERDAIREDVRRLEADHRRSERLVAMGELAAGVAHEIRNPLNSISMAAQRLRAEYSPSSDRESFDQLVSALSDETERIGRIIDGFLRFARPPRLQSRSRHLDDTLAPVLTMVHQQANPRGVTVQVRVPRDIEFSHDPDQINQAVLNLLINALEAVEDRTGQIELEAERESDDVRIRVADNGRGIAEEDMDRIFDLYFTTKPDGTGFGLAQVQQVVAEHDGSLDAVNRPEGGAAFTIRLPARKP